jgi:hypothetical protein
MRELIMKGMLAIAAVAASAVWNVTPATAADAPGAPPGVMTSSKTLGEVSIAPVPQLVNGELILKVVARNQSQKPAIFGPEDLRISTADGKAVAIMSLDALIAQVKAAAQGAPASSGSYGSSYTPGPAMTYNQSGQPDVHNFRGGGAAMGAQADPEAPAAAAPAEAGALQAQIASLRAGVLQDVTIAPGEVKGGEIITRPLRFHWREKHTLRIAVRFNGEEHDFDLPAPPAG